MTDNEITVKTLAYRYKFKEDPHFYGDLFSALFYPVIKEGVKYYMVGRNSTQQFYLGVDGKNQIWKMVEVNDYDETNEQNNYIAQFEKVNCPNLGNIGHW